MILQLPDGTTFEAESWDVMPSGGARAVLPGGCILYVRPELVTRLDEEKDE